MPTYLPTSDIQYVNRQQAILFIDQFRYKLTEKADLSNTKKCTQNLRSTASMSEFYEGVKTLAAYCNIETDDSAFNALYSTIQNSDDRAYFLQNQYRYKSMTIHSAKGLEWDQVLLFAEDCSCNEGKEKGGCYVPRWGGSQSAQVY